MEIKLKQYLSISINKIVKTLILCLLLSGNNHIALAQNEGYQDKPIEIRLWENSQPQQNNNLPLDAETVENPGWINMVTDPVLYVYPASNPNGKALLLCPGGGYAGVAIKHEGKDWADFLNSEGITLAVLKYRMPNKNPEVPIEDVVKALEILHNNANLWGIKENMIGIGGASAGGHLATTVATNLIGDKLSPAYQVLLYPVITMNSDFTHLGSQENLLGKNPTQDVLNSYSNELKVTEKTPQTFIAVSADDTVVPVKNSLEYFEALRTHGVPVALFIYPKGGHGWGYNPDFAYNEAWTFELINWLKNLKF